MDWKQYKNKHNRLQEWKFPSGLILPIEMPSQIEMEELGAKVKKIQKRTGVNLEEIKEFEKNNTGVVNKEVSEEVLDFTLESIGELLIIVERGFPKGFTLKDLEKEDLKWFREQMISFFTERSTPVVPVATTPSEISPNGS